MKEKKNHSWPAWGDKKDRFKATGSSAKTRALKSRIGGKSHITGKQYRHDE